MDFEQDDQQEQIVDVPMENNAADQDEVSDEGEVAVAENKSDIRRFFGAAAAASSTGTEGAAVAVPATQSFGSAPSQSTLSVLGAFNLSLSAQQQPTRGSLAPLPSEAEDQLEKSVMSEPVEIVELKDAVPLLVASAPLLPSGQAIFSRLPHKWVDLSGRNDALGTRCLFASRRHEHSVFEPLAVGRLLRVPAAAHEWQPSFRVPADCLKAAAGLAEMADKEAWSVEAHPGKGELRVVLHPGVVLARMLRRGTALPAACFAWRVLDSSSEPTSGNVGQIRGLGTDVGEFSILCNIEDAAHTQPPRFLEFPLRIEQLRSLGWMIMQERRRREPFVTELREAVPCADAPHWCLEGSLRCEYLDVKGGILADSIGYGKTACTIGLIDCTSHDPVPEVPRPFKGFIPTRATLVLAPTNLHAQWLSEIKKFTGKVLKVLSVPTCAQLKKLKPKDLMEADVVVATYRLFYSTPYIQHLQQLARERRPEFAFPRFCQTSCSTAWAKAYREAFELLPAWAANLQGLHEDDPVTPARLKKAKEETTPEAQAEQPSQSQYRRVLRGKQKAEKYLECQYSCSQETQAASSSASKKRRVEESAPAWPEWATTPQYIPLEAFWWKRVVCDEFHELLSRYPPAQVAVELFHADYKWGLSGTPPCQALTQIRKAAKFFGVQIPTASAVDDGGEAPRKVAQEWLDAFVRRNTFELPTLQEEERIIQVRLTPKERALYAALTQQPIDVPEEEGQLATGAITCAGGLAEPPEIQAARKNTSGLLKLCSHFCPSGATEVLTAEDECERQLVMRREQARAAEREIRGHVERAAATVQLVRHFQPHYCQSPDRAAHSYTYGFLERESRPAIAARVKFLGAAATGTKAQLLARLFEALGDAATPEGVKEMALRVDFNPKAAGLASKMTEEKPPAWRSLQAAAKETPVDEQRGPARELLARIVRESLAKVESNGIPARCSRLRNSHGMPKWPGSIHAEAADAENKRKDLEKANWEWLTDPDNAGSLRMVVAAWKADIQRSASKALELEAAAAMKLQNLQSFSETLEASQRAPVDPAVVAEAPAPRFAKYGSKIQCIVKHVLKLQEQEPGCKMICFVQWEDLKRKIGAALTEFGIQHLTLNGSVWARRAALVRFQYEADSPGMLLLSLEESASGTNLTAANHVLIVHPMDAATSDEAVAFEMQAVGRVRRPGQQRKIHIWRFVTVDTVEQDITEEHQKELWERQQAAVLLSQAVMSSQQLDLRLEEQHAEGEDEELGAGAMAMADDSSTQLYVRDEALAPSLQTPIGEVVRDKNEGVFDDDDSSTQLYVRSEAFAAHAVQPSHDVAINKNAALFNEAEDDASTPLYMREEALGATAQHTADKSMIGALGVSSFDADAETLPFGQPMEADDCTQRY